MGGTTANVFDDMEVYWVEIADKNQTERQIQFLRNNIKPTGYVLDLACGSGRHSIALTREGYMIVGLDASRRLLRLAKQHSRDIAMVLGDIRFLPFKTGTFNAAMSVDTSFGYLPSEADDKVSLAEVRRTIHDKSGGQARFFEHEVRLYGRGELLGLLEGTGFRVRQVFGGYEEENFGADSPRLIFVVVAK